MYVENYDDQDNRYDQLRFKEEEEQWAQEELRYALYEAYKTIKFARRTTGWLIGDDGELIACSASEMR